MEDNLSTHLSLLGRRALSAAPAMAFLLALAAPAHAAVDFFAKIAGVPGDSVTLGHATEINALSYSLAASRNGPNGAVAFDEFLFAHYYDPASPLLLQQHLTDTHIPRVDLFLEKAGEKPLVYLTITLLDVRVTSIRQGDDAGADRGTELVGLRFGEIDIKYTTQSVSGQTGSTYTVKYDLLTGHAS